LKPPYRFYNFLNIVSVFILWQVIVFAVAVLYISYKSVDSMPIYYYIPLLVGCAFIASPITMLFIYIFYRIYVHNIASAFTYNLVTERYRELEKEKPLDTTKKIPEKSPLLDKSMKTCKEGGEEDEEMMFGRPLSREVSMLEIERRNAGNGSNQTLDHNLTSS